LIGGSIVTWDNERYRRAREGWFKEFESLKERDADFTTLSGQEIKSVYLPEDLKEKEFFDNISFPGVYPYTRGIHHNMYRGRLWTMRQFSGFGTPYDSNQRYKYLLDKGQTGLSVAFDLPTLMGYDSNHPRSLGEVGRCGVAVDSLADMEILFDGIPLDKISTSMTINGPAAILLAMYIAVAEKNGIPGDKLRGTIQNDILKEYIAQKEWLFPPLPSIKVITDIMKYCAENLPQWNTISISGYHIREAGATAVQELAFTLADGFTYVEAGIEAGLDVDKFASRLSYFFNSHLDFFEEVAKFRAARRIWAKRMREKYGAKNPRSWLLRLHTQTAGCSLTAQQPENNIVRTAFEALAAVLGGTQSLHTNSMDETLALPTEKAVKIALRTQQIIAFESGVANTVDPFAGSYFMESLTDKMEDEAEKYFERIEEMGGVVAGIEKGFFQREIARSAYRYQRDLEEKKKFHVGINEFVDEDEEIDIPILKIDHEVEKRQSQSLQKILDKRDSDEVQRRLEALEEGAKVGDNVMPRILDAVKAYATIGEISDCLKSVYGEYREKPVF
jgi:methylmalonyl-CoA mutase N-terminal domain/subunit